MEPVRLGTGSPRLWQSANRVVCRASRLGLPVLGEMSLDDVQLRCWWGRRWVIHLRGRNTLLRYATLGVVWRSVPGRAPSTNYKHVRAVDTASLGGAVSFTGIICRTVVVLRRSGDMRSTLARSGTPAMVWLG